MDYTSGGKKEECLEKRMSYKMKDRTCKSSDSEADKHITKLTYGGVCQNFFNIFLIKCDCGSKQCSSEAGDSNNLHTQWGQQIQNLGTRNHIHSGSNHGCGMDEGRNRRRTGHSIRKPGIQRDLCTFAHGANKEQER